ncbi:MAG: hypothetical protein MK158_12145, partial [Dehalococcoidia bacterium]|nr:hypothetical protein [Dehalococcoidia bacterium]
TAEDHRFLEDGRGRDHPGFGIVLPGHFSGCGVKGIQEAVEAPEVDQTVNYQRKIPPAARW